MTLRSPLTALAAATALLAACNSVPLPDPLTEIEVPAAWTAGPGPSPTAPSPMPPGAGWWASWEDPTLAAVIADVLTHNLDLAAAAARVEAAAAQARIAGASLRPQVDAGGNGSRQRQNFIGFPIPGSASRVLSTTSTNLGVSLNLSWEVDLWGRIRAGGRAAAAELAASRADLQAARLSVSAQAAKAHFTLRELAGQIALAEATLGSTEATETLIRRRYEAGLRGPLDLRLAISARAQAAAALAGRKRQLEVARRQLEVLLGRYPEGTLRTGADRVASPLTELPPVPPLLPAELVVRRPDLAAAESRLAAAGARIAEARAALYPRLSFTASGGRRSGEVADLLAGDFTVWSLAGNLLAPLFHGGRLRAGVDLAEAGHAGEMARYAGAALAAFAEVESALVTEEALEAQLSSLAEAALEARAAERLAAERYRAGLADYLPVLETRRQAFTTESRLLEVRRERLTARVDLYLALGGDFATAGPAPWADPPSPPTPAMSDTPHE